MAQQNPFDIKGRAPAGTAVTVDSSSIAFTDSITTTDTALSVQPQIDTLDLGERDTLSAPTQVDTLVRVPDTIGDHNPFEQPPTSVPQTASDQPVSTPDDDHAPAEDSADLLDGLKEISERLPQMEISKNQNVLFIITVLILLLLAVLLAVNRSMINKAYRAIANDNFLRFLFREYKSMAWMYWLFYIYFFINAGLFLYLLASDFGWFGGKLSLLILSIAVIALVYIGKQVSLQVLSSSFPVEKETQLYGFVTMLINILLGIVLTPVNLVSAFAPEPFAKWAIWAGVVAVISFYLFRQLKGLFIAGRFLHSYRFHFFIYLCTAEIAPLLIIGKLAFDKFGF